jgi:hypothetical protein
LRGHPVEQAAKCIIVMVKIGKKVTNFILAVLPGNAQSWDLYTYVSCSSITDRDHR